MEELLANRPGQMDNKEPGMVISENSDTSPLSAWSYLLFLLSFLAFS